MAIAMLGYLVVMLMADQQQVLASLQGLGTTPILWALALSLVNYALRYLRWHWWLNELGHRVPWFQQGLYYLAGFTFTITPGKAGEAIRAVYLKQHGVNYMDSLAALFMERLQDLLAISVMAVLVLGFFPQYQWLSLPSLLLLLLATWGIGNPALSQKLQALERHIHSQWLGRTLRHLIDMLLASARLRTPKLFASGMLLGACAWLAEGFALYLILCGLGIDIAPSIAIGIYALSLLVGAASLLPGGLGSTEATMGLLLLLYGTSPAIALTATLLCRLATLWFAVALGVLAVAGIAAGHTREPIHSPGA